MNSLPESLISADSINTFKNRLDKFWRGLCDYKSDMTGIGNRSLTSLEDTSTL